MADGKQIPEWIDGRAFALAEEIREGRPGLVYCNAGRNRSAFMAALVLVHLEGIAGAEAARRVQDRRPNSLANPAFLAYLEAA